MSPPRSQVWLLLVVGIVAATAGVYIEFVGVLRDRFLPSVTGFHVASLLLLATVISALATVLSRKVGASRPVAVILAATAGMFTTAILFPVAGIVYGCCVGLAICYIWPNAGTVGKSSLSAAALLGVIAVGSLGVGLARYVLIEASNPVATGILFGVTVAIQLALLGGWIRGELRRADRLWSRLVAICLLLSAIVVTPLSWFVGWHGEYARRIQAIAASGGYVTVDRKSAFGAISMGWRSGVVSQVVIEEAATHDWKRELVAGPPMAAVVLADPSKSDLKILGALDGRWQLTLTGQQVDDALLATLPPLELLQKLTISETQVSGEFLGNAKVLPNLEEVTVRSSPFSNTGMSYLGRRDRLAELFLDKTHVTPMGLAHVSRLGGWTLGRGRIPFNDEVWELFADPVASAEDPRMAYAEFIYEGELPELVERLRPCPDDLYFQVRLGPNRHYDRKTFAQITSVTEPPAAVMVSVLHVGRIAESIRVRPPKWVVLRPITALLRRAETDVGSRLTRRLAALGELPADAARTRVDLIRAVGPAGLPGVIQELDHPDKWVRYAAISAMINFGAEGSTAVEALIERLDDVHSVNASQAIAALARMGEAATSATPRLIQLVRDPQSEVRGQAAKALSQIGPARDVLPILIEALEDEEDSGLQYEAARAIGHLGPAAVKAESALLDAMKDGSLRQRAADSLARIGTDSAVASALPVLIVTLHNVDPFDGEEAAATLGAMGPDARPAVPALVDVLADRANTGRIRFAAARALGELAVTTSETQHITETLTEIRQVSRDDRLRNVIETILAKIAVADGVEPE